jgi:branched-chain amino acid transport system permease protein
VKVFVISAVLAGLCGGLWALSSGRIEASMFDLRYSILFVTMVVIGGMGNIWGGMMGAIALTFITKILELQIPQWFPTRPSWLADPGNIAVVLYGLLLILFMLFLPKGITFGLSRLGTLSKKGGGRVKDRLRAIGYRGG